MKHLVILGAGTGGTMLANRMNRELPRDWSTTVIDPSVDHMYQPGLLFLPFGAHDEDRMIRPRARTLHQGVQWIRQPVKHIDTTRRLVFVGETALRYDLLAIATGSHIQPQETEGLLGPHWYKSAFDFYTLQGARALRRALANFHEGRLVVNVVEMPIKCPVAPLEFAFLADDYFRKRGRRDNVEITLATPLDGAFTRPVASAALGSMLGARDIHVENLFSTGSVDGEGKVLHSWDERTIPYDLLVSIPTHMGAEFIEESGLGDDLRFVPTDHHTLLASADDHIFVLGDATNLPSSKAGSVAHFQSEVVAENILRHIHGQSPAEGFDGHANCFIETGRGKALLIDFNYEQEPLPGSYPIPYLGPMSLLKDTRRNHWGKLASRWLYWNALLPAHYVPIPTRMSMTGKKVPPEITESEAKKAA